MMHESIPFKFPLLIFLLIALHFYTLQLSALPVVINDITLLNSKSVHEVMKPKSTREISERLRNYYGAISIGGGRNSMGGQTALENSLHLDMRRMDSLLNLNIHEREVLVQAGMSWRQLQEKIDPYELSVRIMQTYANFTVGGSISVNVHGRYMGEGPIVRSVQSFKMVLANGDSISREGHSSLAFGTWNATKNFGSHPFHGESCCHEKFRS
jgi:FAD/FMN-containing dehydrogenase